MSWLSLPANQNLVEYSESKLIILAHFRVIGWLSCYIYKYWLNFRSLNEMVQSSVKPMDWKQDPLEMKSEWNQCRDSLERLEQWVRLLRKISLLHQIVKSISDR